MQLKDSGREVLNLNLAKSDQQAPPRNFCNHYNHGEGKSLLLWPSVASHNYPLTSSQKVLKGMCYICVKSVFFKL